MKKTINLLKREMKNYKMVLKKIPYIQAKNSS